MGLALFPQRGLARTPANALCNIHAGAKIGRSGYNELNTKHETRSHLQLSFFTNLGLGVQIQERLITQNTREEIHRATQSLLSQTKPADVVAALFFAHPTITAAFPAEGARAVGWGQTPLLCIQDQELPPSGLRIVLLRAPAGTQWVGLRGANTAKTPTKEAFLALCTALLQQNPSLPTSARGMITTVTSDLEPFSPQESLRELGWSRCISSHGFELNVPSLPKVVRVFVLMETLEPARHVFLGETVQLRPDLLGK